MKPTRRQFVLGSLAFAGYAHAQQLAHAGWRGNGIAPESWWKHATFVRCEPTLTFVQITKFLDVVSQVGADTVILPDLRQKTGQLFAPEFGTEDDLDVLLREVSARRMHMLLPMPLPFATANPDAVRFWINRGIAGFDLGKLTDADTSALNGLRTTVDRYPGQRILIASTTVPQIPRKRDALTLHIVGQGGTGATNQLVEVNEVRRPTIAKDASALPDAVPLLSSFLPLLLTDGAPILDSRLLQHEEDRSAVQQVLQLRSTRPVFRGGKVTAVSTGQPDLHAWVVRGRDARETLLLAVNDASATATLKLSAALAAQRLPAGYVRPLLRSDGAMGALNVETGVLPPGAAVVGELRGDSYAAPSTTLDPDAPPPGATRHSHRRRRRR